MEKKKLVFVSVPMSGKDDALIERNKQITIAGYLKATGQSIKDVAFYDNHNGCLGLTFSDLNAPALGYLSKAILMLGKCDEAIFGQGWKEARGCKIEHDICENYGIKIVMD